MPAIGEKVEHAAPGAERIERPPAHALRRHLMRAMSGLFPPAFAEWTLERAQIEVTRHAASMPGLTRPARLVQISDLHRSRFIGDRYLTRVARMVNELRPDVVALTGDFVTYSSSFAAPCARALSTVQAPLGLYAVLGNHDYYCDHGQGAPRVVDMLESEGIRLLTNRSVHVAELGLTIAGVDDCWTGSPDPDMALRGVTGPVVALTHNPAIFPELAGRAALTLAGHTHGGQILLPLLTRRYLGPSARYLRGWYEAPGRSGRLYVSRGLGMVGMPFRFRCPSEIAVFELVGG